MASSMVQLRLIGRVILILVFAALVVLAALKMDRLYALMALFALPFILAFEIIDRKSEEANQASLELDMLQEDYPDVPRNQLLAARSNRSEGLLPQKNHEREEAPRHSRRS